MVDLSLFQPGNRCDFDYPRHNFHEVLSRYERRRIVVKDVRDMSAVPIDPVTVQLQPLLRRGRWLVTGDDLDRGVERSFYVESMRDVRASSN